MSVVKKSAKGNSPVCWQSMLTSKITFCMVLGFYFYRYEDIKLFKLFISCNAFT